MSGVQSVERAFSILRVLARGRAGVTDIADRTDLPKSTVSRLLTALEHEGAVEQVEWGGEYVLGPTMQTLAGSTSPRASYGALIRPFLEDLSRSTGGSAGFTLRQGREVFWVDNVDDDAMVQVTDRSGESFPMHSVPTGLAILARLDPDELSDYLSLPLEPSHPGAPRDRAELGAWLDRAGDDGLVVSEERLHEGINAYAAAFRGSTGAWEGAVYVQGPSFRFPEEGHERRVRALVIDAAIGIGERLTSL